jgi:hypothetical protein
MPSAAGAPTRRRNASREPMITTKMTNKNGSISRKNVADRPAWNGLSKPSLDPVQVEDEA